MMDYMLDRLKDIADAAGAFEVRLQDYLDKDGVYRTPAWHMIGTCRMGDDPATSVVNKWQQCWDVPNLFIVDGSVLATGGVVNPTPPFRRSRCVRQNTSAIIFTILPTPPHSDAATQLLVSATGRDCRKTDIDPCQSGLESGSVAWTMMNERNK